MSIEREHAPGRNMKGSTPCLTIQDLMALIAVTS